MHFVYILKSLKSDVHYIGMTNNLERRVNEHNTGQSYWTKRHMPFHLIYFEGFLSDKDAREREKKLKQFKKGYSEIKKRITNSLAMVGGG
ncbi:MAG: hypothetical protein A2901_06655 [Elusimicrobia bacterium RIFCSPLOWO2_01_FULL_54_10]|nr:MAG: hypothetical protein A2901_06655 [Elusimicrobia bacterium RIFCSPLOWO2_01_FULL_54_10]